MCVYLGDDRLGGAVVPREEVVGLDEELAGVLLHRHRPPLSQDDGTRRKVLLLQHRVALMALVPLTDRHTGSKGTMHRE